MPRLFNGTSDIISVVSAAGFSEDVDYTVAAWLKGTPSGSTVWYCETRSASGNPFLQLRVGSTTSKAAVTIRNDAGGTSQLNSLMSVATVFDGTWHHFIYTQAGAGGSPTTYQFYVDGVVDRNSSYAWGTTTTINQAFIGAFKTTGAASAFCAVTIADLVVLHRNISAKEALDLANGLSPMFLNPDHYWPLWGLDSPEPDLGKTAHVAGTLTGTTKGLGGPKVSSDLLWLP